jgi:hypothetical protein
MKIKTKHVLVALFIGAIVLLFLFWFRNKESLTADEIGKYDYLKPPDYVDSKGNVTPNTWSESTIVELGKKMDLVYNYPEHTTDVHNELAFFYAHVKEEEALFFINNGFWPINGYVKERLPSESILIPADTIDPKTNQPMTKQALIDGALPNRYVYVAFIMNVDAKEDPQPLAYRIFAGLEEPPRKTPLIEAPPVERFAHLNPTTTTDKNGNAVPNVWSEDVNAKVNVLNQKLSGAEEADPNALSYFRYNATEEEALYFLQYERWPIDGYVQDKLRSGTVEIPYNYPSDVNMYIDGLYRPNRWIYEFLLLNVEEQERPQSYAYRIFAGLEQPPKKTGTYDYLKPTETTNADGTTTTKQWRQETIDRVTEQLKRNKIPIPSDSSFLQEWFAYATETEAIQFIYNERWPINGYVKEKLKNESFVLPTMNDSEGNATLTKELIADGIMFPNRLLYMKFLMPLESSENPKPLSYKIYMGTEKPPCPA